MSPRIRPLEPRDVPVVHEMIGALAAFHDDEPKLSREMLHNMALTPTPWVTILVAEVASGVVGYAALMPTAQLQFGARGLDVHNLYVKARSRGTGVGSALLAACRAEAARRGCAALTVATLPGNGAAERFYEARGFARRVSRGARFGMAVA